jgi:uncharacterized MAPEG superfamily protein
MTIALWCVLAAALVPYLFIGYAKATPAFMQGDHNKTPREYEEALSGARKRAYWAQLNGFEAFPFFAAGVFVAHLTGAPQGTADALALTFIGCRLVYGVLYVANLDKLRSLAWFGGFGATVALFLIAA